MVGGKSKKNNPPRKFYISYLPHFISLVVACGIVVDFVSSQGVITHFLTYFGMEPQNLLSNKVYYIVVYVLRGIWKNIGWGSIIYLATLSGVDQSLYEAAAIDGAGRFQQIRHITLPALVPIISIQLIMRMGQIMSMSAEKTFCSTARWSMTRQIPSPRMFSVRACRTPLTSRHRSTKCS